MRVFEAVKGPGLTVEILPAMFDNFMYGLRWDGGAAIIDPSEGELVLQWVRENELNLTTILNTHHHGDHTFGNLETKEGTGAELLGADDDRLPGLDRAVTEGEEIPLGPVALRVMATPGHGDKDISFYLPVSDALPVPVVFVGDTLFGAGCGMIMEGSAEALYASIQKLAALPDETLVLVGHEYTLDNLAFATSVFPEHAAITKRMVDEKAKREQQLPTMPATLALEKQTNPFLLASDVKEFTDLRMQKNRF